MSNGIFTVFKNHMYYRNSKDNWKKPPWFINCSRTEAEEILKKYPDYGNVLIRPSSSFPKNGSYSLSAVAKFNGETKFVHYQIVRTSDGFKLEVQSKPRAMSCLDDVLEYYVTVAGCQTHHALILDPTDPMNEKPKSETKNKNLSANSGADDSIYLPMTGGSKILQRRVSAPVVGGDYVNLSKTTGKNRDSEIYVNDSELKEEDSDKDCHDYINVNGATETRALGRSHSLRNTGKSNSFSCYSEDDDGIPPLPPLRTHLS